MINVLGLQYLNLNWGPFVSGCSLTMIGTHVSPSWKSSIMATFSNSVDFVDQLYFQDAMNQIVLLLLANYVSLIHC